MTVHASSYPVFSSQPKRTLHQKHLATWTVHGSVTATQHRASSLYQNWHLLQMAQAIMKRKQQQYHLSKLMLILWMWYQNATCRHNCHCNFTERWSVSFDSKKVCRIHKCRNRWCLNTHTYTHTHTHTHTGAHSAVWHKVQCDTHNVQHKNN